MGHISAMGILVVAQHVQKGDLNLGWPLIAEIGMPVHR